MWKTSRTGRWKDSSLSQTLPAPPSGLVDCDTTAHPAIYAAANALGWMTQPHLPLYCLEFVPDAWSQAGRAIPSYDDAIDWWDSHSTAYSRELPGRASVQHPAARRARVLERDE
jgi:hypothetical protein